MDLNLNTEIANGYHSNSQKTRIITERWVQDNIYCPYCGNTHIEQYKNNTPVADFFCSICSEDYELKSKDKNIANKVMDGAYHTMIERIVSDHNPNFFFMRYSLSDCRVKDFFIVPKYFFSVDFIEKRKPLSDTARRAGWVGCNILLNNIPPEGQIFLVENEVEQSVENVIAKVNKTAFIKNFKIDARGWILDILNCINNIHSGYFTLDQVINLKTYYL